jgi:hypothetical protein
MQQTTWSAAGKSVQRTALRSGSKGLNNECCRRGTDHPTSVKSSGRGGPGSALRRMGIQNASTSRMLQTIAIGVACVLSSVFENLTKSLLLTLLPCSQGFPVFIVSSVFSGITRGNGRRNTGLEISGANKGGHSAKGDKAVCLGANKGVHSKGGHSALFRDIDKGGHRT